MGGASKLMKYIGPALETAGGAAATATGNPEMGVPMMVGGVSSGVGSGVGGQAGQGIAGIGQLASMAGGMMGGDPGTAAAASAAGRTPSTDVMSSAIGAPGGGGMSGVGPLLQKYGPMLAKAGLAVPGQPQQQTQAPPPQPPQMPPRAAPQPAPAAAVPPGMGMPSPMAAFGAYRNFLQQAM